MRISKLLATGAVVALLLGASPEAFATTIPNLVVNGTFEGPTDGAPQDWIEGGTTIGLVASAINLNGTPTSAASFGNTTRGSLSQYVPTQVGETYGFSFVMADSNKVGSTGRDYISASVGGDTLYSLRNFGPITYLLVTETFTATSPITKIVFAGFNVPADTFLTDVSLTKQSAVPLPASFSLFLTGIIGLVGFATIKRVRKDNI